MTPNRRKVLSLLPAATVAGIASPAIAQTNPQIRWRLASSFPKNIDIMWATSTSISKYISEMTDGVIDTFSANEVVPPFQVLDASATIHPGVLLTDVEAERHYRAQRECCVFAEIK